MADTEMIVDIEGIEELEKKLGGLAKAMPQFERTMVRVINMIRDSARAAVPVDTGTLRRSIIGEIETSRDNVVGTVGPTEPYGAPVEFGTRPHFPPVDALKRWAEKRGMNPWAVALAISRKGTKPRPYLIPSFEKHRDDVLIEFKNAIDYLLETL
jgi:HK97 gp10 family phage protein